MSSELGSEVYPVGLHKDDKGNPWKERKLNLAELDEIRPFVHGRATSVI